MMRSARGLGDRSRCVSLLVVLAASAWLGGCDEPAPVPARRVITGLVNATEIDVASKVPGRVLELPVREGDRVTKGQMLARLESHELEAKLTQVNATIEAADARLALARKGARDEEKRAAAKQLDAARHQVNLTRKMYDRVATLVDKQAVPRSKFDEIEFKYEVSRDQLAMAEARYSALQSGARDEEIQALEALVAQARGGLDEVEAYRRETEQVAPLDAEVSKIVVNVGELAATGYPILTLVDLSSLWASFAVREDQLATLHVGDVVQLEVPALGRTVPMRVDHVAVLGDFATWKATSDKDRFDLKSFEVKARPEQPVEGLRPGMTVRVTL